MRVIYTAGVFDLLHRGHLNALWHSKQLGDVLVVGVVSDAGARAYKGRSPAESVQARIAAVARLGFVDQVMYQASSDPSPNLIRVMPDVFTHGDAGEDWSALREQVARFGIEYVDIGYTMGISTTQLREDAR